MRLDLESHGRDDLGSGLDFSRTVGWFTALFPAYLQSTGGAPVDDLMAFGDQLQQIAHQGAGYGILRYLHADGGARLRSAPAPELLFNYLGRIDAVLHESGWQAVREQLGPVRGPSDRRPHLFEVTARIERDRLRLDWIFSRAVHDEDTVRRLANDTLEQLRAIRASVASAPPRVRPADFPLARVKQSDLDRLLANRRNRITPTR